MLNEMFALAEKEDIIIRYTNLPLDILGVYYSVYNKPPVILLHKKLSGNPKLTKCILAEELGHHFTCGLNLVAFAREKMYLTEKYERLALWWAAKYLTPWPDLVGAVLDNGLLTVNELAEHFDVTERFMWTCLSLYNEKCFRDMAKVMDMLRINNEFFDFENSLQEAESW